MKSRNWFWGLFFVAGGLLVIANQLGFLANIGLFSLVCTIILLPVIIKSCIHLNFGGILFPMALLAIIYAKPLGITALTPWPVLIAALFGTVGLSLIFHKSYFDKDHCHWEDNHEKWHDEHFDQIVNQQDGDIVDCRVNFGSSIKYVNSENFQKGNFGSSFGALKVYFDNAKIGEKGAIIHLDISFSGVELYIPRTWKIINNVNCSLGGIEEKNRNTSGETISVYLEGNVKFSGVEIIYI